MKRRVVGFFTKGDKVRPITAPAQQPLFIVRHPSRLEPEPEEEAKEVTVYHDTYEKNLPSILKNGLRIQKCMENNILMDESARRQGVLRIPRCRCIFTYLKGKNPMAPPSGEQTVTLALKVNPNKVFVGDMDEATESILCLWIGHEYMLPGESPKQFLDRIEQLALNDRFGHELERGHRFARFYQMGLMTLKEYFEKEDEVSYMHSPEVLIPFAISPSKISLVGIAKIRAKAI